MSSEYVSDWLVQLVRHRANERCEYCLLPQEFQDARFHIDHVRPYARGGKSELDNLALACVSCSLHKGVREYGPDFQTGKRERLFNPRKDVWSDHLTWADGWTVAGRTPVGNATIALLQLNHPKRVRWRSALAFLGQFP